MTLQKTQWSYSFKKVFLIFFTSFLLGVYFSHYIQYFYNTGLLKTPQNTTDSLKSTYKKELDFTEFWEIYDILKKEYYGAEEVDKKDIEKGIITGLVDSLGDPHSEFMDPETNQKFQEVLSGDFEGIGAVVEKVPLGVQVERILKWSPAKKAGVLWGDIIVEANSIPLEELDLYDAVEKIKGDAGTTVVLKIFRIGEPDFIEVSVVRAAIVIPSVESEVFERGIGYITINRYGETTTQEFQRSLQELVSQDVRGLIVDVRDNGGGYLQSAVEILSEFIEDGEVLVQTKYRDSFFNKNYYSSNEGVFEWKVVVLVNRNSASASEITAWALREYNKAIIIWEQTYGKGSVQQPFDMDDGSLLKLTIAEWLTPKWKTIEEEGIEPDILVEFQEEDYENEYDRQLEEAKIVLQKFIEGGSLQLTVDQYNSLQK